MEVYWRSARNYNVCLINPELAIFAIPGLTLVSKRYHFLKKSIKFSSLQKMPHELLHFILMEGIVAKKELLLLLLAPPPANLLYLEDSFQQLFRAAGIKCLQGEDKDSAAITLLLGPNEFETCPWHCQPSGWCREPVDPFERAPQVSQRLKIAITIHFQKKSQIPCGPGSNGIVTASLPMLRPLRGLR